MAGDKRQQSLYQKLLMARSLGTGFTELAALQKKAEEKRAAEKRAADKLSMLSGSDSDQSSADALSHSISIIHSIKSLPVTHNERLGVRNHDTRLGSSRYGSTYKSMRSVRSYEDYHKSYNADDPRYIYQRRALEGIGTIFYQRYIILYLL